MQSITHVRLFITNLGNHFMIEIANIFAEGFINNSISVEILADELPSDCCEENIIQIIVAPHEFYPLFLEKKCSSSDEILKFTTQCYLLNVEQPGSPWFEIAFAYSQYAKGVFDINQQGIDEFNQRNINAIHLPLGYASFLETKESLEKQSKKVDILFLGTNSPKRDLFLSKNSDFLNKYNCRLIIVRLDQPRLLTTPGFYADEERNSLISSSKIILNIHFADRTYFEWHRALIAMANHCLFISENSDYIYPLTNREHMVVTDLNNIIFECEYYLQHETERRKIVQQAYEFVTKNWNSKIICKLLLDKLKVN
ncbi:hypothetical protein NIES4101_72300 [Calothrix sp. NIES-4101]|nr:hypothetical protein NIES4101_72300 [Calothrix sp. NIES-4101]